LPNPNPLGIAKTFVFACRPAREPPQKVRGLGEFFGRGRGGISPSWVWAKPKVLPSESAHIGKGTTEFPMPIC